jgi:hypothetical protein
MRNGKWIGAVIGRPNSDGARFACFLCKAVYRGRMVTR